jgi:hypothetical protein
LANSADSSVVSGKDAFFKQGEGNTILLSEVLEQAVCEGIKPRPPAKANLAGGLGFILLIAFASNAASR